MDIFMKIPVIFFHKGNQEYLKIALKQCRKYNEWVVLLGDESNRELAEQSGCQWYSADVYDLSEKWAQFEHYYKHMSTNDPLFELNCFRRFYIIYEFILKNGIEKFVYLDSDILTYTDFSSHVAIQENDLGMCAPKKQDNYRWVANCGISLWNRESLNGFLNNCIDIYKNKIEILTEKWQYHQKNHKNGGICDMTLEYLWFTNNQDLIKINFADRSNGLPGVMDFNVNSSLNYHEHEYEMMPLINIKKIKFQNELPHFQTENKEQVPVLAIHFLGAAKQYMKSFEKKNHLGFEDYVIWFMKKMKHTYWKK